MKITFATKSLAFAYTFCRAIPRWFDALCYACGRGAYRPYTRDEVPLGHLVYCSTLKRRATVYMVVGSRHRGNIPVACSGGALCFVELSNDALVNSVAYLQHYRYIDGTRCGVYDPYMRQEDVNRAMNNALIKVAWA